MTDNSTENRTTKIGDSTLKKNKVGQMDRLIRHLKKGTFTFTQTFGRKNHFGGGLD